MSVSNQTSAEANNAVICYNAGMSVEKIVKFDGESIVIPPELREAGPQNVKVVFEAKPRQVLGRLLDVVGRAPRFRSDEELDAELRREREAW